MEADSKGVFRYEDAVVKEKVFVASEASKQTAAFLHVTSNVRDSTRKVEILELPAKHLITNQSENINNTFNNNRIQGTEMFYEAIQPNPLHALEEDNYITALSTIIQRDFFPSLTKMRMQNDFLSAVENVDLVQARKLGKLLAKDATPLRKNK